MDRAIQAWLSQHPSPSAHADALTKKLQKSYTIYGCMLLLPATAFTGPDWEALAAQYRDDGSLQNLFGLMAKHLKITHIASNRPIPLYDTKSGKVNTLRAPRDFTPLWGDFGPSTCHEPPTREDFAQAFWVTAKQNGIMQVWAPRFTMFSRGNVSEKARLLTLPSVQEAVARGRRGDRGGGCAAVDLYAGIGYFAFSYVKAGVAKVLCWDLNPWSIEGLRRGASANRWETIVYQEDCDLTLQSATPDSSRLLVFNETNELAPHRIAKMRAWLPPIRHVNCGMLPSSRASLELAASILGRELGGWVHVHENSMVEEIEQKAEMTRQELESIVNRDGIPSLVQVEHINRLKNYAPGVVHYVLDIAVKPARLTGHNC